MTKTLVGYISRRLNLAWMFGLTLMLTRSQAESQERGAREATSDDDVDEPVFDLSPEINAPKPTRTKKPEYSDQARRAGIQGTVLLRCVVTSEGLPKRIVVIRDLDPELDRLAINALREWRFNPATKAGKPIAVRLSVEFEFRAL